MRRRVELALGAAVVVAAGVALALQWDRAGPKVSALSPGALLAAGGFGLLALAASFAAWRTVLADLGSPLPLRPAAATFSLAQLGKYVPGGVWTVVTHMELARAQQVPRHRAAAALTVTMALSVVTGALLAASTLPLVADADAVRDYAFLLVLLPVLLVAVHPRVLGGLLDRGLRLARRPPLEHRPSWRGALGAAGWLGVMWACFAAHTWLLARDLGGEGAELVGLAAGGFAASWVAGFLLVITPAGVGPREAGLVALLAGHLGAPAATVLAVCSRLLLTAADLVLAGLAVLLARRAARA